MFIPKSVPFIRETNKLKRLEFCLKLLQNEDDFDNVIFTDESSVQMGPNKRIIIAKVVRDESGKIIHRDAPTFEKVKHPLKVHVWGGISRHGATQLHIFNGNMDAKYYTDSILKSTLLPAIRHLYPPPLTHRLWQDNDPKHTSLMAKSFFLQHNINWFKTPAESPDLNVIENVWAAMKRYVGKEAPRTQDELVASLLRFWKCHLTVAQCRRYVDHIHKVIPKVIEANGGFSGY